MKNFIRTSKSVLLCTLIVICICGCGKNTAQYISSEEGASQEKVSTEVSSENTGSGTQEQETVSASQQDEADTEEKLLYIYICGAVNQPGVYILSEGSRVCDLFEAANGLREDAATDYWNQARLLVDGEMIYVPTMEEAKERQLSGLDASVQSADTNTDDKSGKINLNTASLEELMEIPGIGESKAKAIIAYREANGSFTSIEEVKNIEGIKDGVFSKMEDYIVIN